MQLTLHLAATGEIVADNRLVIRIKRVGILGLHHDLVCLQKALHARLPFRLILLIQLLDRLLIQTGYQAH